MFFLASVCELHLKVVSMYVCIIFFRVWTGTNVRLTDPIPLLRICIRLILAYFFRTLHARFRVDSQHVDFTDQVKKQKDVPESPSLHLLSSSLRDYEYD